MPDTLSEALLTKRSEIPYWEFPGVGGRFVTDGTEWNRVLGCHWEDLQAFVLDILGYSYLTGTQVRRYLPEKHPDFDLATSGISALYPVEMHLMNGAGWPGRGPNDALAYHASSAVTVDGTTHEATRTEDNKGIAMFNVRYSALTYALLEDEAADADPERELSRYVIPSFEPAGENLPVAAAWLEYADDDLAEEARMLPESALAPILFPSAIIHRQWLQVPESYLQVVLTGSVTVEDVIFGYWDPAGLGGEGDFIHGMVGSVNDAPFLLKDTGTLLGLPPVVRRYQGNTTDIYLDFDFSWQYRPAGHNRFLRPDATWVKVRWRDVVPEKGPFPEFDMGKVFGIP